MFVFLKGKPHAEEEGIISLEIKGVGYKITIPKRIQKEVCKKNEVLLWTHTVVKEPSFDIYGFTAKRDRQMFLSLMKVSGIGPKKAIHVLSSIEGEKLSEAIVREDIETLVASGMSKQQAQKIVLEIQKELKKISTKENTTMVDILISLGYSRKEALEGVRGIKNTEESISIQLQNALQYMKGGYDSTQ